MPELPHIAILVITFKRTEELKSTLYALQKNLIYPQDKLHVIVSDDSTGGSKMSGLARTKAFKVWGQNGVDFRTTDERSGWGKHVNNALDYIAETYPQVEYVFQIEDDYVLEKELDLSIGAALLQERPNIGMLRYRGTAGTHMLYHQFEADVTPYGLETHHINYLQIDNASQTLYIYSNGPHLKRIRNAGNHLAFHHHYGRYIEGQKLGITEENFAHRVKDGMKAGNAPAIAILPEWIAMHFDHIGETFQGSEDDIET